MFLQICGLGIVLQSISLSQMLKSIDHWRHIEMKLFLYQGLNGQPGQPGDMGSAGITVTKQSYLFIVLDLWINSLVDSTSLLLTLFGLVTQSSFLTFVGEEDCVTSLMNVSVGGYDSTGST